MAMSKFLLAFLVTVFLFISMIQAHKTVINDNGIGRDLLETKIDCGKECSRRCQLSSRQKMCLRACGTCCARCQCVPPGTSGNEDVCPCYANMTTHGGRKKCP
ncbi:hypothetical protein CDL12_18478 [Handroanthus impetiginosus]|uniref:Gibberellin regulated protein n=1 Tax=Handroanthus impetiginosus TaxID=429701 RepID=A0A2G9GUI5_9LAMI|nr:hypothetical protein CDL12_18478 [Handroanthus impetiginosus]